MDLLIIILFTLALSFIAAAFMIRESKSPFAFIVAFLLCILGLLLAFLATRMLLIIYFNIDIAYLFAYLEVK